ncbi:MAG TPA: hypothetical protein VFX48_04150, partial [Saprospiraceae bacterium]|nr:hypothetical protein [Saprospiraceae bacterium]
MIRLILLVYIFCYNAKTSAQVSININGGLNYSNFSYRLFGDEYYNIYQKYLKYSALYNFGIGVEYKIKRITFESGIGIATRGAKDYEPTFLHKGYYVIEHGFIELPVLMAYEILNKRIHVGG